jgi:hypothetical protein
LRVIIAGFLISSPLIVLASAGSPIVWFNLFHLIFLNALIGFVESEIIRHYKIQNKPWIIILGNYLSMAIGFFIIVPPLLNPKFGRDLWSEASGTLLFAFSVAFISTLIIEYFFLLQPLKTNWRRKL